MINYIARIPSLLSHHTALKWSSAFQNECECEYECITRTDPTSDLNEVAKILSGMHPSDEQRLFFLLLLLLFFVISSSSTTTTTTIPIKPSNRIRLSFNSTASYVSSR